MSLDKHADKRCREMAREEKIEFILLQTEVGSRAFNNSMLDLMHGAGDKIPIVSFISRIIREQILGAYSADEAAKLVKEGIHEVNDRILNQMCYAAHTMHTY